MAGAGRGPTLIDYVDVQVDAVLAVFDLLLFHRAGNGQDVILLIDCAELAADLADFGFVSSPVAQSIKDICVAQISHPERTLLVERRSSCFVVHMDVNELVVDRGVAIPVHEISLARPRGQYVAHVYVIEENVDRHFTPPQLRLSPSTPTRPGGSPFGPIPPEAFCRARTVSRFFDRSITDPGLDASFH